MNWFKQLLGGRAARPAPATLQTPAPTPVWLEVDGQILNLAALSPAELAALETQLLARRQAREAELASYLRNLAAERERLLAADPSLWLTTLKLMFGENLGRRIAIQDIGPGMQLQHLVLGLGHPDYVEATGAGIFLRYGSQQAGRYFELQGDTIVQTVQLTVNE